MRLYRDLTTFPTIDLGDYILREQTIEDAEDLVADLEKALG